MILTLKTLAFVVFALILFLLLLKVYLHMTRGVCTSENRLDGKTVLITGANTGIGKETALDLARRGARVILACRDTNKAEKVKEEIIRETQNVEIVVKQLDLSSMKRVRQFAADVVKTETRLDILINNAGCGGMRKSWTDEGLEYQMASNYFGHFLLTNLLLDLILKSNNARIINVSSEVHNKCKRLDVSDLNFRKLDAGTGFMTIYHASKLANVLFSNELARKLQECGKSNVTVNSLHPGVVDTDFFRFLPIPSILTLPAQLFCKLFLKTTKEGAQTTIHLAVADEVAQVTGKYFQDCKMVHASRLANDIGLAKKLWEATEQMVELTPAERHI